MGTYGQTSGEQTPPQTQHSHPPPKPPKVESRQDTENDTRGGHKTSKWEKRGKDPGEKRKRKNNKEKERRKEDNKKKKGKTKRNQWKKEIRRSSKKEDEGTSTMSPLFRVAMHGMFSPSFVKGVTPLKTRNWRMKILSKSRSHRTGRGVGESFSYLSLINAFLLG